MKYFFSVVLGVFLMITANGQTKLEKKDLKTNKDSLSYAIGFDIGKNFQSQQLDVEASILAEGIKAGLTDVDGNSGLFTQEEMKEIFMKLQEEMTAKQQEKVGAVVSKNKEIEDKFLAENKKNPGVVVLPSGLQYKVINQGAGVSPKTTDQVTVHYRGSLINGQVFDSSLGKDPITFPVTGVIPGWTEALQLMKVGDKWELYIPSALAYGDRGAGQVIEPGATLIFEVELLGIAPAETK